MCNRHLVRGFTAVELVAVVIVVVVGVSMVLPSCQKRTNYAWQLVDSTQIRDIHQGMVLWAQDNSDLYPLPSRIDLADETVATQGRDKDTTANIFSILIYNNFIIPEICVSPAETNPAIRVHDTYAFSEPPTAVNPKKALWDPALNADFTGGKTGNISYAHMLPANERLEKRWRNTWDATQAVVGNRGPEVKGFDVRDGKRVFTMPKKSNTFLIHGGPTTWEGNIAYNDNHVSFETSLTPEMALYRADAPGVEQPDCLFFDETDDASKTNNFLGIFTKAGATKAEYTAIWD